MSDKTLGRSAEELLRNLHRARATELTPIARLSPAERRRVLLASEDDFGPDEGLDPYELGEPRAPRPGELEQLRGQLASGDAVRIDRALKDLLSLGAHGARAEVAAAVGDLLQHPDDEIRELAALALGGMSEPAVSPAVVQQITQLLNSPLPFAWDTGTTLVRRLGPALQRPDVAAELDDLRLALKALMNGGNRLAREAAIDAVGVLPSPAGLITTLVELLKAEGNRLRSAIYKALAAQPHRSRDSLRTIAEDFPPDFRQGLVFAGHASSTSETGTILDGRVNYVIDQTVPENGLELRFSSTDASLEDALIIIDIVLASSEPDITDRYASHDDLWLIPLKRQDERQLGARLRVGKADLPSGKAEIVLRVLQ